MAGFTIRAKDLVSAQECGMQHDFVGLELQRKPCCSTRTWPPLFSSWKQSTSAWVWSWCGRSRSVSLQFSGTPHRWRPCGCLWLVLLWSDSIVGKLKGLVSWGDRLRIVCVQGRGLHPKLHAVSVSFDCSFLLTGFPCWAPDFRRCCSEKAETCKCACFSPCMHRVSFLRGVTGEGEWVQTKSRWAEFSPVLTDIQKSERQTLITCILFHGLR